jgi:hypothetical protein
VTAIEVFRVTTSSWCTAHAPGALTVCRMQRSAPGAQGRSPFPCIVVLHGLTQFAGSRVRSIATHRWRDPIPIAPADRPGSPTAVSFTGDFRTPADRPTRVLHAQ